MLRDIGHACAFTGVALAILIFGYGIGHDIARWRRRRKTKLTFPPPCQAWVNCEQLIDPIEDVWNFPDKKTPARP